ncbi:MAG: hypothetical protein FWG69_04125 [Oscillospiraceae bacterium]|nr:hypothetical protein [Oscillospiraceae bacterium]
MNERFEIAVNSSNIVNIDSAIGITGITGTNDTIGINRTPDQTYDEFLKIKEIEELRFPRALYYL